jgi:hypothetical protein
LNGSPPTSSRISSAAADLLMAAQLLRSGRSTCVSIYGLATLIVLLLNSNGDLSSTGYFQLLGLFSIAAASISILIPIFHRMSASDVAVPEGAAPMPDAPAVPTATSALDAPTRVMCPSCATVMHRPLGEITCSNCQAVFLIRVVRRGESAPA